MQEFFKHIDITKIFTVVFVASLGTALALGINAYIEYKFFTLPPIQVKPVKANTIKQEKDYSNISLLFENVQKEKIAVVKEKNEKPQVVESKTSLGGLSLVGTIIINNEKYALINVGNNPRIVKIGSSVSGYTVKDIGKYYVALSRNGKIYKLTVKVDVASSKYTSRRSYQRIKSTSTDTVTYKLDRRYVEEQTSDIGKILKDVFVVPVVRNGETVGFKFRYVKPGSLLYKYGLRSGDLILSVNDRPVRTVEEAFKIYNILRNESIVKVEVERRGKRKTIIYEIK